METKFCNDYILIFFVYVVVVWQPVIWLGLGLVAIIKFNFDYLLVVAVALVLNIANIIGFTRCQKGTCDTGC